MHNFSCVMQKWYLVEKIVQGPICIYLHCGTIKYRDALENADKKQKGNRENDVRFI